MAKIVKNQLMSAAQVIEKQLDQQLSRFDSLDLDDLRLIQEQRMREIKESNRKKQEWIRNGHGVYSELADEKAFFEMSKKSPNIVCHFYADGSEHCRIVDMHLKALAGRHVEAKFCKVNAEKSPFLTQRLRIKVIPTLALIKDSKTKDFVEGFSDLGNCDDFTTEVLEWRLALSGTIDYKGDLKIPISVKKKSHLNRTVLAIKSGYDCDESDLEDY